MTRIKFKKEEQKRFLDLVMEKLDSPSIRGILQFGINIPYSTLKNYYNESRLIPKELYLDLCELTRIEPNKFKISEINENWGKVKGGKSSKRSTVNSKKK